MAFLNSKIEVADENTFTLRSTNFFRPPLRQIGNSIYEIRTHFMPTDATLIILPESIKDHVAVQEKLLEHLKGFSYKSNIATGTETVFTATKEISPSLGVLMDSFALAMDFDISPRPRDVSCDIFLAICGQPVIVLTLVDGDKNSRNVKMYSASVAKGVTDTLRKFMDESINIVFGVLHQRDFNNVDLFLAAVKTLATNSSMFVTSCTLETSPSKYEKILTAFWAGVAETRSVISFDDQMDTDYLRFLTKDQCVILMENINKREVEVQFQTGTGATTLMVEVARRLSKLDNTLLVCASQEEKERLKSVYPVTKTIAELELTDLCKYTNFVGAAEAVSGRVRGKLWNFTKVYSEIEQLQLQLQHEMERIEDETANMEKLNLLISLADRQEKMNYLIQETETLKLFDVRFVGLLMAHHVPSILALEDLPLTQDHNGDQRQQIEHWINNEICKLKQDTAEKRDLFPRLAEMVKEIKYSIRYLQVKMEYLKQVSLVDRPDGIKNQIAHSTYKDFPRNELGNCVGQSDNGEECLLGESTNMARKETQPSQERRPSVTAHACVNDGTSTKEIEEIKEKLATVKMDAEHKKRELSEKSKDYGAEWRYNMEKVSQNIAQLKLQDVFKGIIGGDEFPVITCKLQKSFSFLDGDCKTSTRGVSRCQVHQLRKLQFGRLGHSDLLAIVADLLTDDQRRLTDLWMQCNHLECVLDNPIYMVGKRQSETSGPVSCPPMTLDPDQVHSDLSVVENMELTNVEMSHNNRFRLHWGTCSSLPITLPHSPSTLTIPRYWEVKSRLQMKRNISQSYIHEMGICGESEVNTRWWLPAQSGSSWGVRARGCQLHKDICTQVWGDGRVYEGHHRNDLTLIPATGVQIIHWGVVVDIVRRRLVFLDIKRGSVIHRFDVDIHEPLHPTFGVMPFPDDCHVKMRLISGGQISMNIKKASLIANALFSPKTVIE